MCAVPGRLHAGNSVAIIEGAGINGGWADYRDNQLARAQGDEEIPSPAFRNRGAYLREPGVGQVPGMRSPRK